jgi:hypothetical protein
VRDLPLVDLQKPVVVSGAAARVGLQGMGGIGKSVLASVLAHRPEVRRAFPDGIFWITLGQKPQQAELQHWLARELGDPAMFADERRGKECLRKLFDNRKALLVLDDVWQREHADAFNVIGAMGRILLTTRDAGLRGRPRGAPLRLLTGPRGYGKPYPCHQAVPRAHCQEWDVREI